MFRPRESHTVRLTSFDLTITPAYRLRWMRDLNENNIGLLEFSEMASELIIEANSLVEVSEDNPFNFVIAPEAVEYPFVYDYDTFAELAPFISTLFPRETDRLRAWLDPIWHPGRRLDTLELLQNLNRLIYQDIRYQRRERRGVQSPAETLERYTGSCRDFAALFMEACRFLGIAARFVSGYMYSSDITGRMSMHGWAEAYLPGAGWIGFDPSWGILAASRYIPVAVRRHPEHAPPISGTFLGYARDYLRTDVDLFVVKLEEPPEVAPAAEVALPVKEESSNEVPISDSQEKEKPKVDPGAGRPEEKDGAGLPGDEPEIHQSGLYPCSAQSSSK